MPENFHIKHPKKAGSSESNKKLLQELDKKIAELEKKYPERTLSEDELEAIFLNQYRTKRSISKNWYENLFMGFAFVRIGFCYSRSNDWCKVGRSFAIWLPVRSSFMGPYFIAHQRNVWTLSWNKSFKLSR